MSWEGYDEMLCKSGHYWRDDGLRYMHGDGEDKCPECREPPVWAHTVDETNGVRLDENGRALEYTVPYPLEIERYETRLIKIPIFKVPTAR